MHCRAVAHRRKRPASKAVDVIVDVAVLGIDDEDDDEVEVDVVVAVAVVDVVVVEVDVVVDDAVELEVDDDDVDDVDDFDVVVVAVAVAVVVVVEFGSLGQGMVVLVTVVVVVVVVIVVVVVVAVVVVVVVVVVDVTVVVPVDVSVDTAVDDTVDVCELVIVEVAVVPNAGSPHASPPYVPVSVNSIMFNFAACFEQSTMRPACRTSSSAASTSPSSGMPPRKCRARYPSSRSHTMRDSSGAVVAVDVALDDTDVVMVDVAVVGQVPQPTGQMSATGWPSQVPLQRTLGIRNVWQSLKLSSTSWGRLSQETPSPGLCRQSSTMVEVAVDVAVAEWVDVSVDV